jgi:uncharacterized protein YigA (DUF484 family)
LAKLLQLVQPSSIDSMSVPCQQTDSKEHAPSPLVTQSQFQALIVQLEAQSAANRRLEHRVSQLEEELLACREASHDVTQLATQQLQEWTLKGIAVVHVLFELIAIDMWQLWKTLGRGFVWNGSSILKQQLQRKN